MQLAINVGAIVLAFVGLIALTNSLLEGLGNQFNIDNFSLEIILGYLFKPVAFMLGIPWSEAQLAGNLIGQKLVFNEFLAYATFTEEIEKFRHEESSDNYLCFMRFCEFFLYWDNSWRAW